MLAIGFIDSHLSGEAVEPYLKNCIPQVRDVPVSYCSQGPKTLNTEQNPCAEFKKAKLFPILRHPFSSVPGWSVGIFAGLCRLGTCRGYFASSANHEKQHSHPPKYTTTAAAESQPIPDTIPSRLSKSSSSFRCRCFKSFDRAQSTAGRRPSEAESIGFATKVCSSSRHQTNCGIRNQL